MKYKVGDFIYYASYQNRLNKETCPICFGKLAVTIILGNGEHWSLPCDYCDIAYSGPRGYVEEYGYIANVEHLKITGIKINVTENGENYVYKSNSYFELDNDRIFDNREEAFKKCAELVKQQEIEENTRTEYLKKNKAKSFSWNAGYHMRSAKKAKKDMEYHLNKAQLCKEKSKDEEGK